MKGYACIILAFMAACTSPQVKKNHLPVDRMKLIVWDLVKAGEWEYQVITRDTSRRNKKEDVRLYAQVFSIHGVTREQFFDSYKYYEAHPIDFKILVDSIEAYATREKNHPVDSTGKPQ